MKFLEKIRRLFNLMVALKSGTDVEGTIENISKNVALRGANIWLLVCSAILASIGLDINSAAVIIGAMLISPLMSPILGVGLAIAIQDRKLLKDSLKNLVLATILSLLTSGIYFLISPLGELTAQLKARTTPTILDVAVAFFGGVAGIVAGSRRDKTNAIPGVAIATALMPPICTAGFGLAKFDSAVFLGAFYLFFINGVCIALATYLISISLRFPKRAAFENEQDTNVKRFIIGFTILTIIPSAMIFYKVINELRFDRGVKNFINRECRRDERQPVQWEIINTGGDRTLKIYMVGKAVDSVEKERLRKSLADYGINNLGLKVVQLNVSPDEFARLTSDVETNLVNKLQLMQTVEEERKEEIESLQNQIVELKENFDPNRHFLIDVRRLFPEIVNIEWEMPTTDDENATSNQTRIISVEFQKDVSEIARKTIKDRILRLAQARLREDKFQVTEKIPVAAPKENQGEG